MSFLKKSKKRFTVEDCDWSHLKEFELEHIILEFHWFREIISYEKCPIKKKKNFPPFF